LKLSNVTKANTNTIQT